MFISINNLAALTGTSAAVTASWARRGVYPSCVDSDGVRGFEMRDLLDIPEAKAMVENRWSEEFEVAPVRQFNSVELFAGAGGLALGMAKAGSTMCYSMNLIPLHATLCERTGLTGMS